VWNFADRTLKVARLAPLGCEIAAEMSDRGPGFAVHWQPLDPSEATVNQALKQFARAAAAAQLRCQYFSQAPLATLQAVALQRLADDQRRA
jgi:hypothetical protein